MKRAVLIFAAVLALAVPGVTYAIFTAQSDNPQTVAADDVQNYFDLYSFSSPDPWNFTAASYAGRNSCSTTKIATGTDHTMALNLGGQGKATRTYTRAMTVRVAPTLPAGVTSVNLAITAVAGTGNLNPITSAVFADTNGTDVGATYNGATAGLNGQLDLVVNTNTGSYGTNTLATPTIRITITYTGETTGFLRYDIPVRVRSNSTCNAA